MANDPKQWLCHHRDHAFSWRINEALPLKVVIAARRELSQDAHFAVLRTGDGRGNTQGNGAIRRVELALLIETIQLDELAAHTLYPDLRHAIAVSLESHVRFSDGSDCEMAVVPF